jgi:hypothetical protein
MKLRITKSLKTELENHGIAIVRVKTIKQAKRVGIHLLCPTQHELNNAIDVSIRDMFPTIYIHNFKISVMLLSLKPLWN